MNADGSEPRLAADHCSFGSPENSILCRQQSPAWSPDGTRLIMVAGTRNPATRERERALISVAGQRREDVHILYRGYKFHIGAPSWSPDGGLTAFDQFASPEAPDTRRTRIFVLEPATGVVRRLIPEAVAPQKYDYGDWHAVWAPAGPGSPWDY